jgi:hypothetical protein
MLLIHYFGDFLFVSDIESGNIFVCLIAVQLTVWPDVLYSTGRQKMTASSMEGGLVWLSQLSILLLLKWPNLTLVSNIC